MALMMIIGVTLLYYSIATLLVLTVDKQNEAAKENIGNNVIIKGDTLLILDYNFIGNTYTLDNGLKIDGSSVNKFNLIKK